MGRYIHSGTGGGSGGDGYNKSSDANRNKIPDNRSIVKHIFQDKEGHLKDTPENRKLIEDVANDPCCYSGKDARENDWYARTLPDGSQVWVVVRNGVIKDAGKNSTPHTWDSETGFSKNVKKTGESRKEKKKSDKQRAQNSWRRKIQ